MIKENLTTSHFSYQSCEHVPVNYTPKVVAPKPPEDTGNKLYRQDLDDIIKYIESDQPTKPKNVKKKKKSEEKEIEQVAPDAQSEEQSIGETKKKRKKRRKVKAKKFDEESDEEEAEDTPRISTLSTEGEVKVFNLEVKEEITPLSSDTTCLSKLSDTEFDKSINEFAQRLMKIEYENDEISKKNYIKMLPNLN